MTHGTLRTALSALLAACMALVAPEAWAQETLRGGDVACATRDLYETAVQAAARGERETVLQLLQAGQCVITEEGVSAHVQEATFGSVCVVAEGRTGAGCLWTAREALGMSERRDEGVRPPESEPEEPSPLWGAGVVVAVLVGCGLHYRFG